MRAVHRVQSTERYGAYIPVGLINDTLTTALHSPPMAPYWEPLPLSPSSSAPVSSSALAAASWWGSNVGAHGLTRDTEERIFVGVVVAMVTLAVLLGVITLGHRCTYDGAR